ncbi:MAG: arsenate reductase ArsC [Reichenbachiella sp.]|uniref:arsenate reductase ArsC n=1 Tax=Reichenbachiella sp. TaxID=2184521 RepID=UPI0032636BD9
MKNLIILCTGNSCRSQIADGYFKHFANDQLRVYSAGIETHGVNPRAIQVMSEEGIDLSGNTSNNITEYLNVPFDYIITVCDHAQENCPYIPGDGERVHYNFPDPAKATGTEEEILASFRATRQMIKDFAKAFVAERGL